MTIRQIAETAGCSLNTVRKIGKDIYPNKKAIKSGIALDYTKDESINIMNKLPKSNYIADPNLTNIGNPPQMGNVDYVEIGKMIAMAVTSAMAPILRELRQPQQSQPKQLALPPAPDIKPRALLRQLVSDYASSINISHQEAWNELYKQFYYRCNESIKTKAKNLKIIPLDYLENENKLLTACSIMKDLIG